MGWKEQEEERLRQMQAALSQKLSQQHQYQPDYNTVSNYYKQQQAAQQQKPRTTTVKTDTSNRHTLLDSLMNTSFGKYVTQQGVDFTKRLADNGGLDFGDIGDVAKEAFILAQGPAAGQVRGMIQKNPTNRNSTFQDGLFQGLEGLGNRTGGNFRAGIGDIVKGTGDTARWLAAGTQNDTLRTALDNTGKAVSDFAQKQIIDGYEKPYSKQFTWASLLDPEFYASSVARSLPFTYSMIMPSIAGATVGSKLFGAGASIAKLGNVGKIVAQTLGAGIGGSVVSVPFESAFEAANVYDDMIKKGASPEDAHAAANQTFKGNLELLAATQIPEMALSFAHLGGFHPGKFARFALGAGSAGLEGVQEGGQEIISAHAKGEKVDKSAMWESAAVGTLMGAGMGMVGGEHGHTLQELRTAEEHRQQVERAHQILGGTDPNEWLRNEVRNNMSDEQKATINDLRDNLEAQGLEPDEIEKQIDEHIAGTDEGKQLYADATQRLEKMMNPEPAPNQQQANQQVQDSQETAPVTEPEFKTVKMPEGQSLTNLDQQGLRNVLQHLVDKKETLVNLPQDQRGVDEGVYERQLAAVNEDIQTLKNYMKNRKPATPQEAVQQNLANAMEQAVTGTAQQQQAQQTQAQPADRVGELQNEIAKLEKIPKKARNNKRLNALKEELSQLQNPDMAQQLQQMGDVTQQIQGRNQQVDQVAAQADQMQQQVMGQQQPQQAVEQPKAEQPKTANLTSDELNSLMEDNPVKPIDKMDHDEINQAVAHYKNLFKNEKNAVKKEDYKNLLRDLTDHKKDLDSQEKSKLENTDRPGEKFPVSSKVKVKGLSDTFEVVDNSDKSMLTLKGPKGNTMKVGRAAATLADESAAADKESQNVVEGNAIDGAYVKTDKFKVDEPTSGDAYLAKFGYKLGDIVTGRIPGNEKRSDTVVTGVITEASKTGLHDEAKILFPNASYGQNHLWIKMENITHATVDDLEKYFKEQEAKFDPWPNTTAEDRKAEARADFEKFRRLIKTEKQLNEVDGKTKNQLAGVLHKMATDLLAQKDSMKPDEQFQVVKGIQGFAKEHDLTLPRDLAERLNNEIVLPFNESQKKDANQQRKEKHAADTKKANEERQQKNAIEKEKAKQTAEDLINNATPLGVIDENTPLPKVTYKETKTNVTATFTPVQRQAPSIFKSDSSQAEEAQPMTLVFPKGKTPSGYSDYLRLPKGVSVSNINDWMNIEFYQEGVTAPELIHTFMIMNGEVKAPVAEEPKKAEVMTAPKEYSDVEEFIWNLLRVDPKMSIEDIDLELVTYDYNVSEHEIRKMVAKIKADTAKGTEESPKQESSYKDPYFSTKAAKDELAALNEKQPPSVLIAFNHFWEVENNAFPGIKGTEKDKWDGDLYSVLLDKLNYKPKNVLVDSGAIYFHNKGIDIGMNDLMDQYEVDENSDDETIQEAAQQIFQDVVTMDWSAVNEMSPIFRYIAHLYKSGGFKYAFNLDTIGDNELSLLTFKLLNNMFPKKILPVFSAVKIVPRHKGQDAAWNVTTKEHPNRVIIPETDFSILDQYAKMADYIGVGGTALEELVPKRNLRAELVNNITSKYPNKEFHVLGTLDKRVVDQFENVKSSDGTAWIDKHGQWKQNGKNSKTEQMADNIDRLQNNLAPQEQKPAENKIPKLNRKQWDKYNAVTVELGDELLPKISTYADMNPTESREHVFSLFKKDIRDLLGQQIINETQKGSLDGKVWNALQSNMGYEDIFSHAWDKAAQERFNKLSPEERQAEMTKKLRDFFNEADGTGPSSQEKEAPTKRENLSDFVDVIHVGDAPKAPTKYDAARQKLEKFDRLAAKMDQYLKDNKNRMNVLPVDLFGAAAIVGANKILHGVVDFAEWSEQMLNEYGKELRLSLRALYTQSEDIINFSDDDLNEYMDSVGLSDFKEETPAVPKEEKEAASQTQQSTGKQKEPKQQKNPLKASDLEKGNYVSFYDDNVPYSGRVEEVNSRSFTVKLFPGQFDVRNVKNGNFNEKIVTFGTYAGSTVKKLTKNEVNNRDRQFDDTHLRMLNETQLDNLLNNSDTEQLVGLLRELKLSADENSKEEMINVLKSAIQELPKTHDFKVGDRVLLDNLNTPFPGVITGFPRAGMVSVRLDNNTDDWHVSIDEIQKAPTENNNEQIGTYPPDPNWQEPYRNEPIKVGDTVYYEKQKEWKVTKTNLHGSNYIIEIKRGQKTQELTSQHVSKTKFNVGDTVKFRKQESGNRSELPMFVGIIDSIDFAANSDRASIDVGNGETQTVSLYALEKLKGEKSNVSADEVFDVNNYLKELPYETVQQIENLDVPITSMDHLLKEVQWSIQKMDMDMNDMEEEEYLDAELPQQMAKAQAFLDKYGKKKGGKNNVSTDKVRPNAETSMDGTESQNGEKPRGKRNSSKDSVQPAGDSEGPSSAASGERNDTVRGPGDSTSGDVSTSEQSGGTGPRVATTEITNYFLSKDDITGIKGKKTSAQRNLDIIKLAKQIESEGRPATQEEKKQLVQYVGWGGLKDALNYDFQVKPEWKQLNSEIKEVLTKEEFSMAQESRLYAHYTAVDVIEAMYEGLKHLGFDKGRMLEPAAGIGHFIGMVPSDLRGRSRFTAVEIDPISALIGRLIYPKADFRHMGFEEADMPDNFYDVAIGNVPFHEQGVHDKNYPAGLTDSLHNYFFVKTINKVRPGGIVMMITSSYTMDAKNPKYRKYLADRAEFLGAIRLPNNAFQENAGTEVTTDIIILKKLPEGQSGRQDWVESDIHEIKIDTPPTNSWESNAVGLYVNPYFIQNPNMVMGELQASKKQYGGFQPVAKPNGKDLKTQVIETMKKLPADSFEKVKKNELSQEEINRLTIPAPDFVKEGAFHFDKRLYVKKDGNLVPLDIKGAALERIKGLINVRNSLRALFQAEADRMLGKKSDVEKARKDLNTVYDAFVKKHKPLNDKENVKAFQEDPDYYLLMSIENYDKETKKAIKGDIFTKSTSSVYVPVEKVDTPHDGMLVSLNELGYIDLNRVSELTGLGEDAILKELEPFVFKDPLQDAYVTREEYLSGNVRQKLEAAKAAAKLEPIYERNVEELEKVIPQDIPAEGISIPLGAGWVPNTFMKQFIGDHLLDLHHSDYNKLKVSYNPIIAQWSVSVDGKPTTINQDDAFTANWGHPSKYNTDFIEAAINNSEIKVYKTIQLEDGAEKKVVDKKATLALKDRVQRMRDEFTKWIFTDEDRKNEIVRTYNDKFNSFVLRKYDGQHLTFPGMNPEIAKLFRPYQKDAVYRSTQGGDVLFAHAVGAGKTFEMIASMMELKRLGQIQKPIWTVPNHLVEQMARDFQLLYPAANVLVPSKKDFQAKNRKALFAKIATRNYDVIIMPHSSFGKLSMSPENINRFMMEQIDQIQRAIELEVANGNRKDTRLTRSLEGAKKAFRKKMAAMMDKLAKDTNTATFEELGVDGIVVDEAHEFKNLFFSTRRSSVGGLGNSEGSGKAFDLYMKVRYLNELNGGKGVIFATGTPISNSLAEMYHMMRYLAHDSLKALEIENFDAWANNFADIKQVLEMAPEGKGYRKKDKVGGIINAPELLTLFRSFADVKTTEELLGAGLIKHPKTIREIVEVESSQELRDYIDDLVERAQLARKKMGRTIDGKEDNMLWITNDGRKAALDMRMIYPNVGETADNKIKSAANKVYEVWNRSKKDKGTQLVFMDLGTPGKESDDLEGPFDAYNAIKNKLLRKGIPHNEIAFIHDAKTDDQKAALFDKVNAGDIRILIGSSGKMGAGMNVQKRLKALHHVDVPWRPSDIEQREGRILRHGNTNEEVEIYTYVQKDSFDAYMWQLQESKAKIIARTMSGDLTSRTIEDDSDFVMNATKMKSIAANDPRIFEYETAKAEVERLEVAREDYVRNQSMTQYKLKHYIPSDLDHAIRERDAMTEDVKKVTDSSGDKFKITIDGRVITSRTDAGNILFSKIEKVKKQAEGKPIQVGEFSGFPLMYVRDLSTIDKIAQENGEEIKEEDWNENLYLQGEKQYFVSLSSPDGTITSIESFMKRIPRALNEAKDEVERVQKQKASMEKSLTIPFEFKDELDHYTEIRDRLQGELSIDENAQDDFVDGEGEEVVDGETPPMQPNATRINTGRESSSSSQSEPTTPAQEEIPSNAAAPTDEPHERKIKNWNMANIQKFDNNGETIWIVEAHASGKDWSKFSHYMTVNGGEYHNKEDKVKEFRSRFTFKTYPEKIFNPMPSVDEELRNRVNSVNGDNEGIVAPLFRGRRPAATRKYAFEDSDIRDRTDAAMEIPQDGFITKVKNWLDRQKRRWTREFEYLPHTAGFSPLRHELLRLEKQRAVAMDKTAHNLHGLIIHLSRDQYELYRNVVLTNDLMEEMKLGHHKLPFGFTEKTLRHESSRFMGFLDNEPSVKEAIELRRKLWAQIKRNYIRAFDAIGVDVSNKFSKKDYYRRLIIDKAKEKRDGIPGKKELKTPKGQGYMKKREGSELDYVTDYILAESEVMANMYFDMEVAKTIHLVDQQYNIESMLKSAADQANKESYDKLIAKENEERQKRGDLEADGLTEDEIDEWMANHDFELPTRVREVLKQYQTNYNLKLGKTIENEIQATEKAIRNRVGWAYAELKKLAADGTLWKGNEDEFDYIVDDLANGGTDTTKENFFVYLQELLQSGEEGSKWAGQYLKYNRLKDAFRRDLIGDKNFRTVMNSIPEGYDIWRPDNSNVFYMANTLPEHIIQRLFNGVMDDLTEGDFSKVLAMGGRKKGFIVPVEVKKTLENLMVESGRTMQTIRAANRTIKGVLLVGPTNLFKYNARNMTGDLEKVITGSPSALKFLPRATQELKNVFFKHAAPSKEMQEWLQYGGMQTLVQSQEFGDLKSLSVFRDKVIQKEMGRLAKIAHIPAGTWNFYWTHARKLTDYRESLLRYAAYLDYLDQLEKNNGKPKNYGASLKREIDALGDNYNKAFQLSNELLIAYDKTSANGRILRDTIFGFFSFIEGNIRSYIRVFKNIDQDGELAAAVGRKLLATAAVKSPMLIYRTGKLAMKLGFMTVLLALFNNLFHHDEEEELPEDVRNTVHIILGRNDKGEVVYFNRLGTLEDFLEWFGVDDLDVDIRDVLNGKRTFGEVIGQDAWKPVNKLVNAVNPIAKQVAEQVAGVKFFPDFRKPQQISDRFEHFASLFAANKEYAALRDLIIGRPNKGYKTANFVAYTADPEETNYYNVRNSADKAAQKYLDKQPSITIGKRSEKSQYLYEIKQGLKYHDRDYAQKFLDKYYAAGGTDRGLHQSLNALNPLSTIPVDLRQDYYDSLNSKDQQNIDRAYKYYRETLLDGFELNN